MENENKEEAKTLCPRKKLRGPLTPEEIAHLSKYPVDKDQQLALDLNEHLVLLLEEYEGATTACKQLREEVEALKKQLASRTVTKTASNRVGKTTAAEGRRK